VVENGKRDGRYGKQYDESREFEIVIRGLLEKEILAIFAVGDAVVEEKRSIKLRGTGTREAEAAGLGYDLGLCISWRDKRDSGSCETPVEPCLYLMGLRREFNLGSNALNRAEFDTDTSNVGTSSVGESCLQRNPVETSILDQSHQRSLHQNTHQKGESLNLLLCAIIKYQRKSQILRKLLAIKNPLLQSCLAFAESVKLVVSSTRDRLLDRSSRLLMILKADHVILDLISSFISWRVFSVPSVSGCLHESHHGNQQ
jgi:hypothetical protein